MKILINQEKTVITVADKIVQMYIQCKKPNKNHMFIITTTGHTDKMGEYETEAEAREVLHAFILWMIANKTLGTRMWEELNITERMFEMPESPIV